MHASFHARLDARRTALAATIRRVQPLGFRSIETSTGRGSLRGAPQGHAQVQAGREVLACAVRFPALPFVVFGLIASYFRLRRGDRPIELDTGSPS